ncbi:hypothetical protein D3C72_724020 [compost metagenome]
MQRVVGQVIVGDGAALGGRNEVQHGQQLGHAKARRQRAGGQEAERVAPAVRLVEPEPPEQGVRRHHDHAQRHDHGKAHQHLQRQKGRGREGEAHPQGLTEPLDGPEQGRHERGGLYHHDLLEVAHHEAAQHEGDGHGHRGGAPEREGPAEGVHPGAGHPVGDDHERVPGGEGRQEQEEPVAREEDARVHGAEKGDAAEVVGVPEGPLAAPQHLGPQQAKRVVQRDAVVGAEHDALGDRRPEVQQQQGEDGQRRPGHGPEALAPGRDVGGHAGFLT